MFFRLLCTASLHGQVWRCSGTRPTKPVDMSAATGEGSGTWLTVARGCYRSLRQCSHYRPFKLLIFWALQLIPEIPESKIVKKCLFTVRGLEVTIKSFAQVPAKDIVERAKASAKDGDTMCSTSLAVAQIPETHEEDGLYNALRSNKMLVDIPWTYVNLGEGLEQHPCFHPRDLITALDALGKLSTVIGVPLESCSSA